MPAYTYTATASAAIHCGATVKFLWMIQNTDKCVDSRGEQYLRSVFCDIAYAMDCETAEQAANKLNGIFDYLELDVPTATAEQFEELKTSVNPIRLKNHPIALDTKTIDLLYASDSCLPPYGTATLRCTFVLFCHYTGKGKRKQYVL